MKRREFIRLFSSSVVAWPLAARAQQAERMRRISLLVHGLQTDSEWQRWVAVFRQELAKFGWSEDHNIQIESRFSGNDLSRLPQLARELVALRPEVIFVNTTPATRALQQETHTIPIVFVQVSDPIGSGIVASLARPATNATGFLFYESSIAGKWLGMLKEIAPHLRRAALIGNPKGFPFGHFLSASSAVAPSFSVEVVPAPIENTADIEHAIETFSRMPNGGLLVPPGNTVEEQHDLIIALAAKYRLPAVYAYRFYVTAGGLMSYGTDAAAQYRQAASYVDRILRGAHPADLPVEAPTKYETVLNLKTAKALGLDVPPTLLVRADEVIE